VVPVRVTTLAHLLRRPERIRRIDGPLLRIGDIGRGLDEDNLGSLGFTKALRHGSTQFGIGTQ